MVKVIATSSIEPSEYYDPSVDGIVWESEPAYGELLGPFGKAKLRYLDEPTHTPTTPTPLTTGKLLVGGGKRHAP